MSNYDENEDELLNIDTDEDVESQSDDDASDTIDSVEDAEEVVARKVAKKLGWVSPEEWTDTKRKPMSASEYLDRTVEKVSDLKEKNRRLTQVQESYVEDVRRKALQEAEAEVRRAVNEGDEERAVQAHRKAQQYDPNVVSIKAKHSWIEDEVLFKVGDAAVTRGLKTGKLSPHSTLEEQAAFGEQEVRKRFPEFFDDVEEDDEPVVKTRQAPNVQPISRNSSTVTSKSKGWEDIPSSSKKAFAHFVDAMVSGNKVSLKEAQASIAKNYWKEAQ